MTDANNVLSRDSLGAAMQHFADESVWAVAGRRGELGSAYDRYEDAIRRLESRSGSVAAMSGEFVAVRRRHLPTFPEDVIIEDLWLLCQLVRAGGRVVYEPGATSMEPPIAPISEIARRSRNSAALVPLASQIAGLPPAFAFRLISHKLARLALPFLLLAALGSSLALARQRRYTWIAGAQLGLYLLGAAATAGWQAPGPAGRVSRLLGQLLVGNLGLASGVLRAVRGRQEVLWQPVR